MADDLDEQTFQARYNALRDEYLAALPQRRAAIAELWRGCAQDDGSSALTSAWQELHTLVHRLSGSAPCYGLDEVGGAAQQLDRLLSGKSPCHNTHTLDPLIAQLLAALDAATAV